MTRNEYKAVTERIVRAHQLPITQREEYRETLDALMRQAARYEFEHHMAWVWRVLPNGCKANWVRNRLPSLQL